MPDEDVYVSRYPEDRSFVETLSNTGKYDYTKNSNDYSNAFYDDYYTSKTERTLPIITHLDEINPGGASVSESVSPRPSTVEEYTPIPRTSSPMGGYGTYSGSSESVQGRGRASGGTYGVGNADEIYSATGGIDGRSFTTVEDAIKSISNSTNSQLRGNGSGPVGENVFSSKEDAIKEMVSPSKLSTAEEYSSVPRTSSPMGGYGTYSGSSESVQGRGRASGGTYGVGNADEPVSSVRGSGSGPIEDDYDIPVRTYSSGGSPSRGYSSGSAAINDIGNIDDGTILESSSQYESIPKSGSNGGMPVGGRASGEVISHEQHKTNIGENKPVGGRASGGTYGVGNADEIYSATGGIDGRSFTTVEDSIKSISDSTNSQLRGNGSGPVEHESNIMGNGGSLSTGAYGIGNIDDDTPVPSIQEPINVPLTGPPELRTNVNSLYDSNGRLAGVVNTSFDSDGKLVYKYEERYEYDINGERTSTVAVKTNFNSDGSKVVDTKIHSSYYNAHIEQSTDADGKVVTESFIDDARTRMPNTTYTVEINNPDGTKKISEIYEDFKGDKSLKKSTTDLSGVTTTVYEKTSTPGFSTTYIERPDGTKVEIKHTPDELTDLIIEYDENGEKINSRRQYHSIALKEYSNNDPVPERVYIDKYGSASNEVARIVSDNSSINMLDLFDQYVDEYISNPQATLDKNICDILEERNWEREAEEMLLNAQNIVDHYENFISQFDYLGGDFGHAIEMCLDQSMQDAKTLATYIKDNQYPAMRLVERLKELIEERKELLEGTGDGEMNYNQYKEEKENLERDLQDIENRISIFDSIPRYVEKKDEDGNKISVPNPAYDSNKRMVLISKKKEIETKIEVIKEKMDLMVEKLLEIKLEVKQVYVDIKIYGDTVIKFYELAGV